ncbi:MAG TPA: hypothetical protein VGS27_17540 [Candidatus Sulfotelmatobacter sp.]|nr:hypothetical protein [Candidatus Sulfotelmatobacter sp.]
MKQRNCRIRSTDTKRVMRYLAEAAYNEAQVTDPILEKLGQCPEAFKVGEILGKAFDSLKYWQDDVIDEDRIMPPPGTILPPFA